ncbi:MAG: response regulator [Cyclobacteriaceae bacterium]
MAKSILVVDDTPDLLESIREFLVMEGYQVATAVNGQDGLSKLESITPDLIITDLLMPVMDGFTFIEHVKENKKLAQIPIIIFSAKPQKENAPRAEALGIKRFIIKPSPLEDLLQSVEELVHP